MKRALLGTCRQGSDCLDPVAGLHAPDPDTQARRRQQMKRFSILAAGGRTLSIDTVVGLPICCEPVLGDDGVSVVGINFWAADASADSEADYAWGEFLGDQAVQYVRRHGAPEFLTSVLQWMGASLYFEDRCPGPLENGFVYRVLKDYPDAVDRFFMAVHRQHPERLN
jgi:hypothetical protein